MKEDGMLTIYRDLEDFLNKNFPSDVYDIKRQAEAVICFLYSRNYI